MASNAVIALSPQRHEKTLRSTREGEALPVLRACLDEAEQSDVVCRAVLAHREEGIALKAQAVLFRAAHHSDHLEVELARRNIPFVKYGGLKFLEAAHVKDALAFLRILENPLRRGELVPRPPAPRGDGPGLGTTPDGRPGGATASDDEDPTSPLARFLHEPLAVPKGAASGIRGAPRRRSVTASMPTRFLPPVSSRGCGPSSSP